MFVQQSEWHRQHLPKALKACFGKLDRKCAKASAAEKGQTQLQMGAGRSTYFFFPCNLRHSQLLAVNHQAIRCQLCVVTCVAAALEQKAFIFLRLPHPRKVFFRQRQGAPVEESETCTARPAAWLNVINKSLKRVQERRHCPPLSTWDNLLFSFFFKGNVLNSSVA